MPGELKVLQSYPVPCTGTRAMQSLDMGPVPAEVRRLSDGSIKVVCPFLSEDGERCKLITGLNPQVKAKGIDSTRQHMFSDAKCFRR